MKLQVNDLQRETAESGNPLAITNYFTIVVRKMVEQVLQVFCKVRGAFKDLLRRILSESLQIIARYLTECSNKDRLVLIALEHLVHLVLFGDELCLEAIQVRENLRQLELPERSILYNPLLLPLSLSFLLSFWYL